MSFISGFITPVQTKNRESYIQHAKDFWPMFKKHGALRMVEGWGVDLPDGKVTDFKRAVKAEDGETVLFSWVEWPDKATCDKAWAAMMEEPEMQNMDPSDMPFDGKRMFWGGFEPVVDVT